MRLVKIVLGVKKVLYSFLLELLGLPQNRKCTIPSTKAIFFPVIEKECSFAEEGEQLKTEEDLVARAKLLIDLVSSMEVTINGINLKNPRQYRARSRVFDLTFPQDNVYHVKPGPTRSVTDGYWVFLKPLRVGKHILHFIGESFIPAGPIAQLAKRYVNVRGNLFKTEVTLGIPESLDRFIINFVVFEDIFVLIIELHHSFK